MGMTIDNHIEVLKSYHNGFTGYVDNLQDSIDVAIETMRKYEKIKQIINEYKQDGWTRVFIDDLEEVMEDGNDE